MENKIFSPRNHSSFPGLPNHRSKRRGQLITFPQSMILIASLTLLVIWNNSLFTIRFKFLSDWSTGWHDFFQTNHEAKLRVTYTFLLYRHHQKYKDVKQISKHKAGLNISCRIEQLIKEWHGQIIHDLVFLHETEHPKHEQSSQMINGPVAHVELEHEIVKWTSSITNSLALICNTVLKRCSVALNGSG